MGRLCFRFGEPCAVRVKPRQTLGSRGLLPIMKTVVRGCSEVGYLGSLKCAGTAWGLLRGAPTYDKPWSSAALYEMCGWVT